VGPGILQSLVVDADAFTMAFSYQPRSPGITKLLAGMIAVPMLALFVSTSLLLRSELQDQQAADSIVRDASRLERLVLLDVSLRTETSMAFLLVAARKFGVPIAMGNAMMGMDVPQQLVSARTEVDRMVDELGSNSPVDARVLARARFEIDSPDMVNVESSVYASSLRATVAGIETQLLQLRASASSFGRDSQLLAAQYATEHSTRALSIGLDQVGPVTSSAAGMMISKEATSRMIATTANLRLELDQLSEAKSLPRQIAERTKRIQRSEEHKRIMDFAIAGAPSQGAMSAQTRQILTASATRSEALAELSRESTQATSFRAQSLAAHAARQVKVTVVLLLAALLASVAVALALGRTVSVSLRRVERRARDLVEGQLSDDPLPTNGPREIAVTAAAINQLASEYALLGEQTSALASGQFGDETFAKGPTGPLGQAVHDAVRRLASSVRENEQTRQTLKHDATHDALTSVHNRAGIYEILNLFLSEQIESSLIFIDLDRFKALNDDHGHLVGDEVLRQVGQRLMSNLRQGDIVGRLGGDEFVMICQGALELERLTTIAQRIVQEMSFPFQVGSSQLLIGASVGIARSVTGDDASSLLARADESLYTAKAAGRGRVGTLISV
jgi:diguanylate cyclase (GGDEF)-like protein